MKSLLRSLKLILLLTLFATSASSVSAFYDSTHGRWLNRDPANERGGGNLYRFGGNNAVDAIDTWGEQPMAIILFPIPLLCLAADPLPNTSPECDSYGDRLYKCAYLKCFCKCAPNDPWSQFVRGCLRCMDESGVPDAVAHQNCYAIADALFPGQKPSRALAACWLSCIPNHTPEGWPPPW